MNDSVEKPSSVSADSLEREAVASMESSNAMRRSLFKKGAVAVGVTLASRPVLAWHCKTTSAWGSELLNPATSLKNDTAHPRVADEGWFISDWANNSNTNGAMGSYGTPWSYLASKYPSIVNRSTKTNGVFDFRKVTVSMLVSKLAVARPSGISGTAVAYSLFSNGSSNFGAMALAAQLNYLLLSPLSDPFNHEKCVSLDQLKAMAELTFVPSVGGAAWTKDQVVTYLSENYIIR